MKRSPFSPIADSKHMKALVLIAGLLLTLASDAFAYYSTPESLCTPIDLRTEFPMKIRDQGAINWCYAHATADYLQFYNRLPVQISAADVAIYYNRRFWPRFLQFLNGDLVAQTGLIRDSLRDLSKTGYCPEEYLPSDRWIKKHQDGALTHTEAVDLKVATQEIAELSEMVSLGIYTQLSDLPFVYVFKDVSAEQFFEILSRHPLRNLFNELRAQACDAHRTPFPNLIPKSRMHFRGKNTFVRINHVLDQHLPVSVDFFYQVLENQDEFKRKFGEIHTTLLTGRRFNAESGECQYLIKNSYGTDCSSYDPRHQCEGGNIWVNESVLYRAMTSYVHIL